MFAEISWNIANMNEENELHSRGLLFDLNTKRLSFFCLIAKNIDYNSRIVGSHLPKFRENLFENGTKIKETKVNI